MTLTLVLEPAVPMVRLYNDLPGQALADARIMIEIGDLYAKERRRLRIKLKVPGKSELGAAKIAALKVAYIDLSAMVEYTARLPVVVNVVPGDEAAMRLAHPRGRVREALSGCAAGEEARLRGIRARPGRVSPCAPRRGEVPPPSCPGAGAGGIRATDTDGSVAR